MALQQQRKASASPAHYGRLAIQLVRGTGLASRAIAWWGGGWNQYSHTDAMLPDGSLLGARSDRTGGRPAGVQIRPADYQRWLRRTLYTRAVTQEQQAAWVTELRGYVGVPYDRAGILRLVEGKPPKDDGRWFCSALQLAVLQSLGYVNTPLSEPPQAVTPDGLALLLSGLGWQAQELPV
jgi:hypothetical protein